MHRLPRVSPDVPIQYKDYTIPPGASLFLLIEPPIISADPLLGSSWDVGLLDALRCGSVRVPVGIYSGALAGQRHPGYA